MRSQSDAAAQPPQQAPQPQEEEELKPLDRQSSIYSMTLDELQNSVLGKPYCSMNIDEFLTNVWGADDAHFPPAGPGGGSRSSDDAAGSPPDRQNSLARQGSFTLPVPLSGKTVEEVWSGIQRGEQVDHSHDNHAGGSGGAGRQITFGEMTLEDFLIKAGVVREAGGCAVPSQPPPYDGGVMAQDYAGRPIHLGYQAYPPTPMPQMPQPDHHAAAAMAEAGARNGGYYAGARPGPAFAASPVSPLSSVGEMGGGSVRNGRKRIFEGPVEKVVERRQRRMIKNRESAARSRARKQAYTVELEAELNQLKEENTHLRKEMDVVVEKFRQKFDELARARKAEAEADRKRKLRRVNSWHG